MKEVLKDILKELQYQTKLMENIFHKKDTGQSNLQQMQKSMELLISNISKMPGMNQPKAQKMMGDIMKIIPGGK